MTTHSLSCRLILVLAWCAGTVGYAERPWPFYLPDQVDVPDVAGAWVRNDIDRFILEKLQDNQLTPADEASKRTLIRRLYFDLIGLPPTPDEITEFVRDDADDAYAKLVDRLLEDTRYGERWARFWLDLARYADTAGYEGDPDLPHAWRYRDYVIDSLNKDKPYNEFIREQIAGDEFDEIMGAGDLPSTPPERIVAMTFLRLAPFTEPRGDQSRHELLSEMTSTVGSVFLGLTVGCAKCHDHKHDDIPTADFYRMKAFFATVQIPRPLPGDAFQIGGPIDASFYREGEQSWASDLGERIKRDAATAGEELARLREGIADRLGIDANGGAGLGIQVMAGGGNDYFYGRKDVHDGQPHMAVITSSGKEWSIHSDGQERSLGSLAGVNSGKWFADLPNPKHISLGQYTSGTGDPQGNSHVGKFAEVLIYDRVLDDSAQTSLTSYFHQKYSGDGEAGSVQPPQSGLRFWLDASDTDGDPNTPGIALDQTVSQWVDKIGRITLSQSNNDRRPILSAPGPANSPAVEFTGDSFLKGSVAGASFLGNEQGSIVVVYSATHDHEGYGFEVGGDQQFLSTFINPTAKSGDNPLDQLIRSGDPSVTADQRHRFEYLTTRERFTQQHLKRLMPVAMSLRHSYGPPYEPGVPVSRIMIRGEHDAPGDVVQPGFLSAITGNQDAAAIRLDPFKRWPTRSRRMALADWIASPKNPMTARVMVNRLWHWHFGRGIVRTPSDFGHLSGGPSHRELLDWLAVKFVEDGWSIKAVHRLICNSATYRQSSARVDDTAMEIDPENRLLWRFNRRRLEAEAIRDNVLAVSGRLNPQAFGLPIFPPLPDDLTETVKYSESKWDTQHGAEGRRRSIYIYQQRTLTMPLMQSFDALVCDESRPRREATVTPLQALAMYNGQFVNEEAKHFAARVKTRGADNRASQIDHAFQLALGRSPRPEESDHMRAFIDKAETPQQGLIGLCRILMNANEFIYID